MVLDQETNVIKRRMSCSAVDELGRFIPNPAGSSLGPNTRALSCVLVDAERIVKEGDLDALARAVRGVVEAPGRLNQSWRTSGDDLAKPSEQYGISRVSAERHRENRLRTQPA